MDLATSDKAGLVRKGRRMIREKKAATTRTTNTSQHLRRLSLDHTHAIVDRFGHEDLAGLHRS